MLTLSLCSSTTPLSTLPDCKLTKRASRGRVIFSSCFLVVRWIFKGTGKGAGTYCMSESGRKQGFRRNLPPSPHHITYLPLRHYTYSILPLQKLNLTKHFYRSINYLIPSFSCTRINESSTPPHSSSFAFKSPPLHPNRT